MRGYTVDEIMATQPCANYPRERVEALWGGRESLTVAEIATLGIPVKDRLYQVIRLLPLESIPVLARRYADDVPTAADALAAADRAAAAADRARRAGAAYAYAYFADRARGAGAAYADELERYLGWAVEAHQ